MNVLEELDSLSKRIKTLSTKRDQLSGKLLSLKSQKESIFADLASLGIDPEKLSEVISEKNDALLRLIASIRSEVEDVERRSDNLSTDVKRTSQ